MLRGELVVRLPVAARDVPDLRRILPTDAVRKRWSDEAR